MLLTDVGDGLCWILVGKTVVGKVEKLKKWRIWKILRPRLFAKFFFLHNIEKLKSFFEHENFQLHEFSSRSKLELLTSSVSSESSHSKVTNIPLAI